MSTTKNQQPQEPVEETPLPDFVSGVIQISTEPPTLYEPVYKNNDEPPKPEEETA
jgi:hypothetical protein